MKFTCQIGEAKKSTLQFARNWFTGGVTIKVDGRTVYRATVFTLGIHYSLSLVREYSFILHDPEPRKVVVEKLRPHLGDFGRPNEYRVVDGGRVVAVFRGWRKVESENQN
jgi:hypothetical protein